MSSSSGISPFWPADNAATIAHINSLQAIISRLSNNSTSCKTWCLTLVTALLGLAGASRVSEIVTLALVPVVIFWFLDAVYLAQERAYRDLHFETINKIQNGSYGRLNVFEMHAPLSLSKFIAAFRSWAILPIYLGLIVVYIFAEQMNWLSKLSVVSK